MLKKVISGKYNGHIFIAENTWLSGASLYHGDQLLAQNKALFSISKTSPLISEQVVLDGKQRLVEVFIVAWFTVKMQIKVDGQLICGDVF